MTECPNPEMERTPAKTGNDHSGSRAWLGWLAAFLLVAGLLLYIQTVTYVPDSDRAADSFYHVTMGDRFFDLATARTFPATRMSVWNEHFADKELGFHALLWAVRGAREVLGLSRSEPPFLVESTLIILVVLGVFAWALRRLEVPQPWLFLPILVFLSPLFLYRLMLVRPHNIAICLAVVGTVLLCSQNARTRLTGIGAVGLMFAWFYSSPHFVLLPAGCYMLTRLRADGWKSAAVPAVAVLGVAVGMTLHPQFPNTFIIWKVQGFDVFWDTLFLRDSPKFLPRELVAPSAEMLRDHLAMLLSFVGMLVWTWCRARARKAIAPETAYVILIAAVATFGFFLSERSIEYAAPFTALALALVWRDTSVDRTPGRHVKVFLAVGMALVIAVPLFYTPRMVPPKEFKPRHEFAAWSNENLPAGTYVANISWGDFPMLFYARQDLVYMVGLDPHFGQVAEPERMARILAIHYGHEPIPDKKELERLLGTRYIYASHLSVDVARRLSARGIAVIYQGSDDWLFDLRTPVQKEDD